MATLTAELHKKILWFFRRHGLSSNPSNIKQLADLLPEGSGGSGDFNFHLTGRSTDGIDIMYTTDGGMYINDGIGTPMFVPVPHKIDQLLGNSMTTLLNVDRHSCDGLMTVQLNDPSSILDTTHTLTNFTLDANTSIFETALFFDTVPPGAYTLEYIVSGCSKGSVTKMLYVDLFGGGPGSGSGSGPGSGSGSGSGSGGPAGLLDVYSAASWSGVGPIVGPGPVLFTGMTLHNVDVESAPALVDVYGDFAVTDLGGNSYDLSLMSNGTVVVPPIPIVDMNLTMGTAPPDDPTADLTGNIVTLTGTVEF